MELYVGLRFWIPKCGLQIQEIVEISGDTAYHKTIPLPGYIFTVALERIPINVDNLKLSLFTDWVPLITEDDYLHINEIINKNLDDQLDAEVKSLQKKIQEADAKTESIQFKLNLYFTELCKNLNS